MFKYLLANKHSKVNDNNYWKVFTVKMVNVPENQGFPFYDNTVKPDGAQ